MSHKSSKSPINWQEMQEKEIIEQYRQKGWPHEKLKPEDYPDETTKKSAESYWESYRNSI